MGRRKHQVPKVGEGAALPDDTSFASDDSPPNPSRNGAAPMPIRRSLRRKEELLTDLERLYWKLEDAQHRLVGELTDRQIKIARIFIGELSHQELLDRLDRNDANVRELSARLAGGLSGGSVQRADTAPPFVIPTDGVTH